MRRERAIRRRRCATRRVSKDTERQKGNGKGSSDFPRYFRVMLVRGNWARLKVKALGSCNFPEMHVSY